ncbi:kinase-like domain-containing protein [Mycena maculata]|uniref:Kinase-like domain-containing protein n=1 Tax=Mycena maculata TaxID=230809 RepID=A0AAD7JYK5_9AGAR|nr:kinase-like domain-containing protein [Mycena maculata]
MPTACWDTPLDRLPHSPASTSYSYDEDEDEEINSRVRPHWPSYRSLLKLRGFRLDTVEDAKAFYACSADGQLPEYFLAKHSCDVEDALCPDAGLPDNLFRGTRVCDGGKVVIKAVHLQSREFNVIRFLSTPPLRDDPMNHCIPVLDLIEVEEKNLAFIVMEQWSSQLIDAVPCCLGLFLGALRQCIEHGVFMHKHRVAHLDISLRNLLTDYDGHYAYIDYEGSRRFDGSGPFCIPEFRATEVPPECELLNGECPDPFKADVWAMAILILRACQLAGYCVAELVQLTGPMLNANPDDRPSMQQVLREFDKMVPTIGDLDQLPAH